MPGETTKPEDNPKFMDVIRHFLTTSKDDSEAKDKAKGTRKPDKRQSRKASK